VALPFILGASLALPFAGRIARLGLGAIRRRPAAALALGAGAGAAAFGLQQLPGAIAGGDGVPRRRRRKALTSDDLRIALTIASAISKKAAENFILQRTRR